jgi:replicative DNA helicase
MQDKTVLYFSLEMPLDQLQNKFVCIQEKLNANKYRSFGFNLVEMGKYLEGLQGLKQWNLYTVCDFNLTPEKMRAYIEKQKKKKLDFVILDYLGLMSGYANKSNYERITLFSRKIKLMAGEFNVPILVLVQLNRDLKQRQDKRPVLSDIRESGAIEQDSDFVLFAHREGYYDRSKPQNDFNLIVAKNRHGEANRILDFDFDLETQTISEKWSREWLSAV